MWKWAKQEQVFLENLDRPEQKGDFICSKVFEVYGPNDIDTKWKMKVFQTVLNPVNQTIFRSVSKVKMTSMSMRISKYLLVVKKELSYQRIN